MKKIYLILLMLLCPGILVIAQNNKQDVVYLKNGSIVRGTITENIFNSYLVIKTDNDMVFKYMENEIEETKREQIPAVQNYTEDTVVLKDGKIIVGKIIDQDVGFSVKIQTPQSNVFVFRTDEIEKKTESISHERGNNVPSQQIYQDIVYLNNGSIIKGTIIEQEFNKSIKIQTSDKNVFAYQIDEIEKMTKVAVSQNGTNSGENNSSSSEGKATVYIVRPGISAFAIPFKVNCDNNYIGTNMANNYISVVVNPGEHTFVSSAENDSELNLNLEAGKTYYLEQRATMGIIFSRNKLEMLDEIKGKKALSKCNPAK
jgi:hypothetical protein